MSVTKKETFWGERAYETLVENASDIISRFDRDHRHLYVNRAITRATGLPPSAFVGKTNADMGMPPDLVVTWDALLDRVFQQVTEETAEFSYVCPDGTARWFRSRLVPEIGADGTVESVLVVARDITVHRAEEERRLDEAHRQRQSAEDKLRERTALLQAISDTSLDPIYAKDIDGRFTFANPATARVIGRPAAEVLGRTDAEFLADQDAARQVMENDQRVLRSGVPEEFEERVPYPDGTECLWLSRKIPFRDVDGRVVGLLGISRDITDRKRAEEAAHEAEKRGRVQAEETIEAKDRLLAAVSHELRNPLTTLWGWLQLMEMNPDEETRRLAMRSMRASVTAQKRMVDDLLESVGFARGTVVFSNEIVDLAEVATEVVETLQPSASASGVVLHARCTGAVHVLGDRARLGQVVVNLVSNALKFTPQDGIVSVAVDRSGDTALLHVSDTGHGIDPEFLPRIFERFTQERTHSRQGLGLGLSIVQEIVQRHGGRIRAASTGTGTGAQFTVELPLQPAPPPAH